MNKETLKVKFKEYVNKFDINEVPIKRKYDHSLRVMEICNILAKENNFNEKDIMLSNIIGILHDYGRFVQWQKYKTFNDLNSIDHADLGVEILFNEKEITNFYENEMDYDTIFNAIKYHNKYSIPQKVDNKKIIELIRDADKLDIFYLIGESKDLIKEDAKIDESLNKDFFNNQLLDRIKIKTESEWILQYLSMVYDLNFKYSYKYLKDNKLIDKIYDNINNKELFKEYFEYIKKYIDERIDKIC